MGGTGQILIFVTASLAILATLVWLGIHCAGVVIFLKKQGEARQVSGRSVVAWILAFVGGFFGPGVFLFSLVALVLGLLELKSVRGGTSTPASAFPAKMAVLTSALMIVMVVVVGVLAVGASMNQ